MNKNIDDKRIKDAISNQNGTWAIEWTYQYSDHCLMRHNKGNLRYGYARFFDPKTVQEVGTKQVDLNLLA